MHFTIGFQIESSIEPQKESYQLGDTITIKTSIKNYSFKIAKQGFGSTNTSPYFYINDEIVYSILRLGGDAMTTGKIRPFGSRQYFVEVKLIDQKTWDSNPNSENNLIIVKSGENILKTEWNETTTTSFYVDPESF